MRRLSFRISKTTSFRRPRMLLSPPYGGNMGKALFDKIWDGHVIKEIGNGFVLLHIDRLLLHDMSGGKALKEAIELGHVPAQPRLIYGTPDHTMSSKPGRTEKTHPPGEPLILSMRENTSKFGIKL